MVELLDRELRGVEAEGELYLVGGAVMCLALNARDATRDVDALFKPTRILREAAARVAAVANVPAQFHDLDDVRYLLRYLNISSAREALDVVTQYFDESQLLPKTKLALGEILGGD